MISLVVRSRMIMLERRNKTQITLSEIQFRSRAILSKIPLSLKSGIWARFFSSLHTIMKLLTQQILKLFRKVWDQMDERDPLIICKFFHPASVRTWYPTEYDEESQIFFGYVVWIENEWWSFTLEELESFKDRIGLWIERDKFFCPCRFSELVGT